MLTLLKKPPKVEVVFWKKPPGPAPGAGAGCGAGFWTTGCGFGAGVAAGAAIGLLTAGVGAACGGAEVTAGVGAGTGAATVAAIGLVTAVARGAGGEVTVGGGAVACAIGLLSARAAMVAGAADMGGRGCGSGGGGSFDMAAVCRFRAPDRADIVLVMVGASTVLTGGRVMLSEASLMPDEFIDMCRKEDVDASDVSAMFEMVDRVEKSGSETGASLEDVNSGIVGKSDIPSVHSAKPESVMSSDGKNVPSPRVGRLDLRDSDS